MKSPALDDINPLQQPLNINAKAFIFLAAESGLTLKSKRASVPEAGGKSKRLLKYSARRHVRIVCKS